MAGGNSILQSHMNILLDFTYVRKTQKEMYILFNYIFNIKLDII